MKNSITAFEKATGIKLNKYMTGKMEGINCLSTSCLCNPYCAARRNNSDMVCSACFAAGTVARYSSLNQNMMRNTEILTSTLLGIDDFPVLNTAIFRLESFGDLVNSTQARNYIRFAKRNPHTQFALWTKNPGILAQAIAVEGKPGNLICILSSAYLDKRCDASRWSFIDKTFTVYRPETVERENISINCGARSCLTCQRCYHKNADSDIRETLK